MSDQCRHCLVRGNYEKCLSTECGHHENWINKVRIKRIEELETAIKSALAIKDLWTYGEVAPEYEGEAEALNKMLIVFEGLIKQ